jgi:pimeloyl-ACP methyl ester carboxylesterase
MRTRPAREAMLRVERSVNWAETERDLHSVRVPDAGHSLHDDHPDLTYPLLKPFLDANCRGS